MSNRAVVQTFVDNGLEIVVRPKPIASPGNVVIRLTVRAVNPIDSLIIRENWLRNLADEHHYHPVIGSEGFGHITEVGDGVTKFKVNQRVVPILYWKYYLGKGEGAWQDYVEVAEEDVVHIPDNVSDDAAAQYLINPWTAYGLLSEIGVKEGEYLLQTAAASVIGRQVIQICKHLKIKTINVVRRDNVIPELKAIGADVVINSSTEDMVSRVKELTGGKGAFAAIDAVGGILTKSVGNSLRNGGRLFVYGKLGGPDVVLSSADLMRDIDVKFFRLTKFVENERNRERVMTDIMAFMDAGVLVPYAGKKYELTDFNAAIEESLKEARGGKVLLIG
ncbi:unnamed protein product [Sphagnum jensenii]|uniref:Enoyl reductase (ER) domain-containing protein n=1 Tax=Sphagnum jensenii TaxID=128206 RepID=A0ABP0VQ84_9BRYO